jgi:iron-sulfur cluster repair protein YtfE (RIC family)
VRRSPIGLWQREHAGLRQTVAQTRQDLRIVVQRLERAEGATRASRRGRKRLQTLERFLAAHFAREESGGYLEVALQAAPRLENKAERLRSEHGTLLREIREIRELALASAMSTEAWAAVARAFEAFADRMTLHDEAENEIMTAAVLEDLGSKD